MRPSRQIYSLVIATVFLIFSTQAIPVNLSYEPDDDTKFNNIVVDNTTAHELALAAYERISHWGGGVANNISTRSPGNANQIVDAVLNQVRNIIRDKNLDKFKVPDFEQKFDWGIGIFKLRGSFRGYNGWLESLLSIARKADATFRVDGVSVVLGSTIGLNTLQLGMNYVAEILFFKVHGNLEAKVERNAVDFEGSLGYDTGKCAITLRTLKVSDLGKINVRVTGLGILNSLYNDIVNWLTDKFQKDIQNLIEKRARKFLEDNLAKIKCPF